MTHAVTIAVPYSYSHLRLRQLGAEFGIDLAACEVACLTDLSGEWDVMAVLGNHVVPPIAARGKRSFFICQFPFPLPVGSTIDPSLLAGYNTILAYSDYAKRNIEAALVRHALPTRPVEVLYPPVPQAAVGGTAKRARILTVGRFFSGGHNKRHDLLIKAFRVLHARHGDGVEFHLAGSSMPDPQHMDYVGRLQELAVGLPVVFHVNASPHLLDSLYQEATIYWHGTGLQEDLKKSPELAEHFGIAIVEAMSAGCVAFALNAGGAPEIITDGVDGCLYQTHPTCWSTDRSACCAIRRCAKPSVHGRVSAPPNSPLHGSRDPCTDWWHDTTIRLALRLCSLLRPVLLLQGGRRHAGFPLLSSV